MEHGSVTLCGLALTREMLQFGGQTNISCTAGSKSVSLNELPDVTLTLLIEKFLVKYLACDNMFCKQYYPMKIAFMPTPFKENFPTGRKFAARVKLGVTCPIPCLLSRSVT